MVHIPMELFEVVLGRHGYSEANKALDRANNHGDHTLLHAIKHKDDKDFVLTHEGIEQSMRKSRWLKENDMLPFDVHVVSGFTRAQQTAQHLYLPNVEWQVDGRLNERHWGHFGTLSSPEKAKHVPSWKAEKSARPFDWRPPGGGQTLAEKKVECELVWRDWNTRHPRRSILCISHGETMQVLQAIIENLSQAEFALREEHLRVGNGCMVQYQRRGRNVFKRHINPHTGNVSGWNNVCAQAA